MSIAGVVANIGSVGISGLQSAGLNETALQRQARPGQGQGAEFSFKLPEAPQHLTSLPGESSPTSSASALNVGANGQVDPPTSFANMMRRMVLDVNASQQVAGEKMRDVLAGGPTTVHEAMIAGQESSVRFQLLSEVRNKVIESYKEVMRMQV